MKHITFCFLLIALLSCGSSRPSSHNRITLQFRDSIIKDYYLLSVRDSSLVVAPYQTGNVEMNQLITESQNISVNTIERVYAKGDHQSSALFFSTLAGAGLGACAASPPHLTTGDGGGMTEAEVKAQQQRLIFFPIGGAIAGGLFGYFAFYRDKEISIASHDNRRSFRTFYSIYPDREPPELQKIR
jgi:hypothetical protein